MKITREELEIRVNRTLDNWFNYVYTPGEISREQTEYYFFVKDLKAFEEDGGDVFDFRDSFLVKMINIDTLKDEQRDFLYDILDFINNL